MARRQTPNQRSAGPRRTDGSSAGLRIVGGEFRGRRLRYSGDTRVRPMKDRVREAVFNLLGPSVRGGHALDLFAGTGALGLEALSRGAMRATFIEQHHPTAKIIRENVAALGVEDRSRVVVGNVFLWAKRADLPGDIPWTVFCSPPYDLFIQQTEAMLELVRLMMGAAPIESRLVVESDERFALDQLPQAQVWAVRSYPPARIAIWQNAAGQPPSA